MMPAQSEVPLSVTFVVTSLHGGGAEAVGVSWMSELAARGHDVDVVLVSDKPVDEAIRERIHVLELGRAGGHGKKTKALRQHLRERRPDVVVGLQTYPNLLALSAIRGMKADAPALVVTEHNLITLGLPGSSPSHRVKIGLAKRWYRNADAVVSCSHPVSAEMVAGFHVAGNKAYTVPNPALAKVADRSLAAREPGVENGLSLVLACRLVPQKHPELAIAVAAELAARGIPVRVESYGGGPLSDALQRAADEANVELVLHGWVEDWFSDFAPNAVVLLPSHREGFGNVLVEAASRGIPSVALASALGVADAIIPGVTGELAASADPADVADAVVAASHVQFTGLDGWLERFGGEGSARRLETVLRHAIASRQGVAQK